MLCPFCLDKENFADICPDHPDSLRIKEIRMLETPYSDHFHTALRPLFKHVLLFVGHGLNVTPTMNALALALWAQASLFCTI